MHDFMIILCSRRQTASSIESAKDFRKGLATYTGGPLTLVGFYFAFLIRV